MSSFVMKLIAAAAMFLDHFAIIFFPEASILRIIGRLAFPIYAYCIAEGFRYTKNRLSYFLKIFILGSLCQIVYTIVEEDIYLGVLITFSISIALMAVLDSAGKAKSGDVSGIASLIERITHKKIPHKADLTLNIIVLFLSFFAAFALCLYVEVDYGFFGILLPVFTNMFESKQQRLVMFAMTLVALCIDTIDTFVLQYWCLFAVPLVALYNGKRGKYSLKYFFYIFYPLHLALLYGIEMFIR